MDSQQQQYCLKWNSFGSNLATSFANLWNSESLADVTLYCEGKSKREGFDDENLLNDESILPRNATSFSDNMGILSEIP